MESFIVPAFSDIVGGVVGRIAGLITQTVKSPATGASMAIMAGSNLVSSFAANMQKAHAEAVIIKGVKKMMMEDSQESRSEEKQAQIKIVTAKATPIPAT